MLTVHQRAQSRKRRRPNRQPQPRSSAAHRRSKSGAQSPRGAAPHPVNVFKSSIKELSHAMRRRPAFTARIHTASGGIAMRPGVSTDRTGISGRLGRRSCASKSRAPIASIFDGDAVSLKQSYWTIPYQHLKVFRTHMRPARIQITMRLPAALTRCVYCTLLQRSKRRCGIFNSALHIRLEAEWQFPREKAALHNLQR